MKSLPLGGEEKPAVIVMRPAKPMRQHYDKIDPEEYDEVEMGDEDFGYTWENLLDLRRFYKKAAKAGRAVIFTVDC